MKVKFEIIVDVDACDSFIDVAEHLKCALCGYDSCDFSAPDLVGIYPELKEFPSYGCDVVCLETFEATYTNNIGGETATATRTFYAGSVYRSDCWGPAGARVDDFFVFHKDANKFAIQ